MPKKTLAELRTRVASLAQVEIGASLRHTPTALNDHINDALHKYFLCMVDCDAPLRMARTTVDTTASTTATDHWPRNEYVELPCDMLNLHALNLIGGTFRTQLSIMPESETEYFEEGYYDNSERGRPLFYRLAYDDCGDPIARLFPAADAVYTIEVVYVPVPRELTSDTQSFNFFPGTVDFVTCAAAMALLEADGVPEPNQHRALTNRRDEAMEFLRKYAVGTDRSGTTGMVNTRARQKRNLHYSTHYRGV